MIEEQIIRRGVRDERVIEVMRRVRRELFIPEDLRHLAAADHPVAIGYNQTISQPYIVAYMTEVLRLTSKDRVLEIGTGSGYQTAVLAEIVKEVYTIEIIEGLFESARERLESLGLCNVKLLHADGTRGWQEFAPYDAIIVTAAPQEVPSSLTEQIKVGGRMIIPLGTDLQNLYLITKTNEGIIKKELFPVRFVPMVRQ